VRVHEWTALCCIFHVADAHLTPRQLSEILDKLDRIVACAETAQQQIRRTTSRGRTALLVTLAEVSAQALSMRDQIIKVMADRQPSAATPQRAARAKGRGRRVTP
jgi:hypothetical protein